MSVKSLSSRWQHLTGTKFGHTLAMSWFESVATRSSRPTIASTDTSLGTGRGFATYPCGVRTTNKEIILNLNGMREEESKRTVLANSRKRADILYY